MAIKKLFLSITALLALPTAAIAKTLPVDPFDFEPAPAIWQISDEDTTIYLFGTIHLLPKQLKWRSPKFNKIVDEADTLVVETTQTPEEEEASFARIFSDMIAAGMQRKPLIERVKPENRSILKQLSKDIDIPLGFMDLLPAWLVPMMVYMDSLKDTDISEEYGVETVLEAEFHKKNKPIISIEDSEAVFAAMNALPEAEQLAMVDEMLDEIRIMLETDEDAKILDLATETQDYTDDINWAKGDYEALAEDMTPETMGEGMYKILLVDRNAAWTEWLIKRLDKPGKILVAVGAGHLTGQDSVQGMLEARGMKVMRIQ